MPEDISPPADSAPRPRLVPDQEEVQAGYELPCELRRVRGADVRLFTFPQGHTDPERTVLCLPGLGASGRSFAPMAPLAPNFRFLLWTLPAHTPLTHTPLQFALVARVMGGPHLPPEGRAEIVREARRMSPMELLRRLRDILNSDYLEALERLRVPTLIIQGERDLLVPPRAAREVAARIPGARLELLREASHLPYMSHPEAFNAFVGDFLMQHLPPPARMPARP